MKVVPVIFVLALATGAAALVVTTQMKTGSQGGKTVTPAIDLTATIQDRLMTIPGLHPVACKTIQGGLDIPGAQCFLSTEERKTLLGNVKHALEPVGQTQGWTNDYSVWGAFYTATRDRRLTFGVNVLQIAGDETLERSPLTRGYRSVVNFVVDAKPAP